MLNTDHIPDDRAVETRYDCPVCVGLPMDKLTFALSGRSFTLDGCKGCGGIWFEVGEMKLAAELGSSQILGQQDAIPYLASKPMACHGCGDLMERNFHKCPSCGWKNVIDCPHCETAMERRSIANLVIDSCSTCDGTWLDRVELRSIAALSRSRDAQNASTNASGFTSSELSRSSSSSSFAESGFAEPSFSNMVDITQIVIEALPSTPEAGQAIVETSASLVEVLAAGLEAAPELAGAVVEGIAGLVASLLSGL